LFKAGERVAIGASGGKGMSRLVCAIGKEVVAALYIFYGNMCTFLVFCIND